jgi:hypothetical protein
MSDDERQRPSRTAGPTREGDSLADVVEMLLDKGVVINADIAVTVGETELLGIHLRAALASFETAAEYGLQFPDGTDMQRVEQASGRSKMHSKGGSPLAVRSPGTSGISPAPRRTSDDEDGEEGDGEHREDDQVADDDADAGADDPDGDGEAARERDVETTDGGEEADRTGDGEREVDEDDTSEGSSDA